MPRGSGSSDGKGKAEGRSLAETAFNSDLSAEALHQAADQGQAETGAITGAAACKAAEDIGQPFGLNATAGVLHYKLDAVLHLRGFEANFTTGRCVAHRVGKKIVQDAAQSAAISADIGQVFEGLNVDFNVFCTRLFTKTMTGILKNIKGTEPFNLHLAAAGVQLSDFNEVCHEFVQTLCLLRGVFKDFKL